MSDSSFPELLDHVLLDDVESSQAYLRTVLPCIRVRCMQKALYESQYGAYHLSDHGMNNINKTYFNSDSL